MPVTTAESAAFLRARAARRAASVQARAAQVRRLLPEVATLLRTRYGATGVWLFGSHAVGRLHDASDVDLAVAGVPPGQIDAAHAAVEALLDRGVDLVGIESATATLVARIHEDGVPL